MRFRSIIDSGVSSVSLELRLWRRCSSARRCLTSSKREIESLTDFLFEVSEEVVVVHEQCQLSFEDLFLLLGVAS